MTSQLSNREELILNNKEILTKKDLAERYGMSKKAIDVACSRNPSSLPPFFKLGTSKNSPIRFRLRDCIEFENKMLSMQSEINEKNQLEVCRTLSQINII